LNQKLLPTKSGLVAQTYLARCEILLSLQLQVCHESHDLFAETVFKAPRGVMRMSSKGPDSGQNMANPPERGRALVWRTVWNEKDGGSSWIGWRLPSSRSASYMNARRIPH